MNCDYKNSKILKSEIVLNKNDFFINRSLNSFTFDKIPKKALIKMNLIKIDVLKELFNERNANISDYTKNFWINCLGLISSKESKISYLDLCETSIKNLEKKLNIILENIIKETCKGVSEKDIVEKAAICLNMCTIPIFFAYNDIEVIQVGNGADYICYGELNNFIFESKGVNSKHNCPAQARKASDQINKSFNIFKAIDLRFGIAGVSCFYNNKHYLIRIQNLKIE